MSRTFLCAVTALGLATPALAGDCGAGRPAAAPAQAPDLVDTALGAGQFTTLVKAVQAAGLVDTLKGPGPFTVFAPTDAAFAKLPAGVLQGLLADKAALTKVLTYHVVPGRHAAADVSKTSWLGTVQGQSLLVTSGEGEVRIDGARVVTADVSASNGVIHVIDAVVLPRKDLVETAVAAGSFQTLTAAVRAAGLVETLQGPGPFTVFAPTDAAFAALPAGTVEGLLQDTPKLRGILTYHVVAGRVLASDLRVGTTEVATVQGGRLTVVKAADGALTVNGAKVVTRDVVAGNGVIHVIEGVALPK